MQIHRNAKTTPKSRSEIIHRVTREGQPIQRVAGVFGISRPTVRKWLRRLGLGRLSALDPKPPAPQRYERAQPGELLHIDIKKLRRIRGVGHRITGIRRHENKGIGCECTHVCIDDHTRLACVEVLADEKKETCCGFLRRAARWFRRQKVTPQSVMTDNGPAYLSKLWRQLCEDLDMRH